MPETPSSPSERDLPLERVLADYLHAVAAGQPPDRDALLARHPDLADELASFFRNRDALERLAQPLQQQGPPLPDTIDPAGPAGNGGVDVGPADLARPRRMRLRSFHPGLESPP
jgi:hypothetical protein